MRDIRRADAGSGWLCYCIAVNKPAPELTAFEPADDAAEAKAIAEAEAQAAAGKVISHQAVRRWLLSWGKADELPPPKCGE